MSLLGGLAAAVRKRAAGRCQYCLIHQRLQGATFHIEHIIPRAKGGSSQLPNLALACPGCNLHKADRTMASDPESGALVPCSIRCSKRGRNTFELTPTGLKD